MNFILSLLGACCMFIVGIVIGFWIEVLTTPPLPNGFVECQNCGPSFVETVRWRQQKK